MSVPFKLTYKFRIISTKNYNRIGHEKVESNVGPGVAKTILITKAQVLPVSYEDLEFVDGATIDR